MFTTLAATSFATRDNNGGRSQCRSQCISRRQNGRLTAPYLERLYEDLWISLVALCS